MPCIFKSNWEIQETFQKLLDFFTIEDGMDKLSRNVGNYHGTLRNIPEERIFNPI
jgi:hypothetical protein